MKCLGGTRRKWDHKIDKWDFGQQSFGDRDVNYDGYK